MKIKERTLLAPDFGNAVHAKLFATSRYLAGRYTFMTTIGATCFTTGKLDAFLIIYWALHGVQAVLHVKGRNMRGLPAGKYCSPNLHAAKR